MRALSTTKAPHLVAAGPVDVQARSPGRRVAVGEVRTELAEVVPRRTEVVVDDVEDDADAPGVAGVDQALEPVGPAVGVVRRAQVDAVVAPARGRRGTRRPAAARPRRRRGRRGGRGGRWRPRRCPRARTCRRAARRGRRTAGRTRPRAVGPGEGAVVDHPGRPVRPRAAGTPIEDRAAAGRRRSRRRSRRRARGRRRRPTSARVGRTRAAPACHRRARPRPTARPEAPTPTRSRRVAPGGRPGRRRADRRHGPRLRPRHRRARPTPRR